MMAPACRVRRLDASTISPFAADAAILEALQHLEADEQLCMRFASEPFALYRMLSDYSYAYCASEANGPVYDVTIWHCGARVTRSADQFTVALTGR